MKVYLEFSYKITIMTGVALLVLLCYYAGFICIFASDEDQVNAIFFIFSMFSENKADRIKKKGLKVGDTE